MTDLTKRLRERADEDAKCAENSKVVADLLRPQLEAFEANEDQGNVYAIRMAVDHRNSVKRDGQYAADLREAATTLETLTQENARLREALEGIVTGDVERVVAHVWRADGKPSKLDQCAHDVQINHDCPSCIEDHARKALGGGDEKQ